MVNVSGWAEGDTGSCSVCAGFQLCKMKTFSNPLYNHMHTGESTAQSTKISERANLCYVFFTTMENKVIYSDKGNTFLLSFYPSQHCSKRFTCCITERSQPFMAGPIITSIYRRSQSTKGFHGLSMMASPGRSLIPWPRHTTLPSSFRPC